MFSLSLNNMGLVMSVLMRVLTGDPCSKWAALDVIIVVFNQDVVISRQRGKVADAACSVFVIHAANLRFGRTLNS